MLIFICIYLLPPVCSHLVFSHWGFWVSSVGPVRCIIYDHHTCTIYWTQVLLIIILIFYMAKHSLITLTLILVNIGDEQVPVTLNPFLFSLRGGFVRNSRTSRPTKAPLPGDQFFSNYLTETKFFDYFTSIILRVH